MEYKSDYTCKLLVYCKKRTM